MEPYQRTGVNDYYDTIRTWSRTIMELYQLLLLIPIILVPVSIWKYYKMVPRCPKCHSKKEMRTPTTNPNDHDWYCEKCSPRQNSKRQNRREVE